MSDRAPAASAAKPVEHASEAPTSLVGWRNVTGKGRGVVALRDCVVGTELERAPIVVVPDDDIVHRDDGHTVLDQYLLYWSDEEGREHALGGGLLMFYNHSTTPNVELRDGPEPDTMSVFAARDIRAGEELLYNYDIELWFEPKD